MVLEMKMILGQKLFFPKMPSLIEITKYWECPAIGPIMIPSIFTQSLM